MSLTENLYFDKSASKPILETERGNKSVYSRFVSSFSVGLMKSLHGNDEIFSSLDEIQGRALGWNQSLLSLLFYATLIDCV